MIWESHMSDVEKIYEFVKAMSEKEQIAVLHFVELLQQKSKAQSAQLSKPLSDYAGILEDSPTFAGDPVEIQRKLRDEWEPVKNSSKTLDFRQAAGLGQEMWSSVEVEEYIQQERAAWD